MECGDSQGEKRSHNWRNIKEKVAAVEEARLVGVRSVARKYGIPSSSISNWMKRETKLKQLLEQGLGTAKLECLPDEKKKNPPSDQLEQELLHWVQEQGW